MCLEKNKDPHPEGVSKNKKNNQPEDILLAGQNLNF